MSLFATGFWIPSSIEFGAKFLDTGLNLYDGLCGALLCTLFSGIQLCMCKRIIQLHMRLQENKNARSRRQAATGTFLMCMSIVITWMFLALSITYCVQFSRNILSLRSIERSSDVASDAATRIFRGCARDSIGTCVEVPLNKLVLGRKMELVFAALAQGLIFITDVLLLIRCYLLFMDTQWVYCTAIVSFVASIGAWIFGLVSLSNAGGLSAGSSWNWAPPNNAGLALVNMFEGASAVLRPGFNAHLPRGYHTSMSIIASLIVNAIVTVAIVSRVLLARRRLQDNMPAYVGDDVYSKAAALIIESASPPVIFGIFAAVFSSPNVKASRKAFEFEIIPKIAWLAFTALAPQLILVRILQGRAWGSEGTSSTIEGTSSQNTSHSRATLAGPIKFSLRDEEDLHMKRRSSYRSAASTAEDSKRDAVEISVKEERYGS